MRKSQCRSYISDQQSTHERKNLAPQVWRKAQAISTRNLCVVQHGVRFVVGLVSVVLCSCRDPDLCLSSVLCGRCFIRVRSFYPRDRLRWFPIAKKSKSWIWGKDRAEKVSSDAITVDVMSDRCGFASFVPKQMSGRGGDADDATPTSRQGCG